MNDKELNATAVSATLHCLTGCAIGEITGLIIGTALGFSIITTIALSVGLAFLFGYLLSALPLLKAGVALKAALATVLAADTVSIFVMELTDNVVMAAVPGAMNAGLVNPLFWATMPVAFAIAFMVAVPINRYMIARGQGCARTHQHKSI